MVFIGFKILLNLFHIKNQASETPSFRGERRSLPLFSIKNVFALSKKANITAA
jgi:hypothetical protein